MGVTSPISLNAVCLLGAAVTLFTKGGPLKGGSKLRTSSLHSRGLVGQIAIFSEHRDVTRTNFTL